MAEPTNSDGFVSPYSRGVIEPTMTAEQVVASQKAETATPETPAQNQDARLEPTPLQNDVKQAVDNTTSRKQETPNFTTPDKPPVPTLEMKGALGQTVRDNLAKDQAKKAYENLQTCTQRTKPLRVSDDFRNVAKPKHGI
jgi:hypothetical protein